jgi:SOS-response transcriptional repressor LexA
MPDQRSTPTSMTVGERIAARMNALGLNQTQLAKRIGVSRTAVGDWLKDKHPPRPQKIPRLAAILEIEPQLLSPFGGDTVVPVDRARKTNYVVMLSWADLIHVGAGGKMKMSALKKPGYIEVDIGISPDCRALRVEDSSMQVPAELPRGRGSDSFAKGDVIILDPAIEPVDGDYVLARLRQTNEHVFRLYVARGKGAYDLVAENPDYPTVTVNARFPADLMGVMVEHRRKRHT